MSFKAAPKKEVELHQRRHIVYIASWAFEGFYNSNARYQN